MDKVIEKTMELAHVLMEDERFLAYRSASEKNDADEGLQQLIGDFNVARMNLSNAASAPEGQKPDMEALQARVRELYSEIMANESMQSYGAVQGEVSQLVKKINAVISGVLDGMLPEEIDLDAACSGNCSSCGGCH